MDLFSVLASTDDTGPRAVIAAQTRAKSVFGRYVGEDTSKLEFITDELRKMAAEVAEEYDYDDAEKLFLASTVALGGGHASDCGCGFCENKGKGFGNDKDEDADAKAQDDASTAGMEADSVRNKTSSTKLACGCDCANCDDGDHCEDCSKKESSHKPRTAAVAPRVIQEFDWEKVAAGEEDRSGDSYQQERESLPKSDGTGLGDTGAVPTDKSKSGDQTGWNLEPIDVDSQRHQLELQHAPEKAEYNNEDFDPGNPVRERVDADSAMQPEFNTGPNTETWSDAGTQASPVTSKWSLLP